jgi:Polyketide cyclase / dehydrase and lipid transport
MSRKPIMVSRDINAPVERVYAILADYRQGHPSILPRPPFVALEVEQGGHGAGTVVRCSMRVMCRTRTFRASISEPESGRVLVETDLAMKAVTTFTVDPLEDGRRSRVTITTDLKAPDGLLGRLERALTARYLRPVYLRELENLAMMAESP